MFVEQSSVNSGGGEARFAAKLFKPAGFNGLTRNEFEIVLPQKSVIELSFIQKADPKALSAY